MTTLRALGLIEDLGERVVDVAFLVEIEAAATDLAAHVNAHAEYDALDLPSLEETLADGGRSLTERVGERALVPTVSPLLELLAAHGGGTTELVRR